MSDRAVWGNDGTKPILDSIFEVYNNLGLLVNFNESYLKRGIKRIVNDFKEPPVEIGIK